VNEQRNTIALGYLLETLVQIAKTLESFGYEKEAQTLHRVKHDIEGGTPLPTPK
jgi:hypothetical protein